MMDNTTGMFFGGGFMWIFWILLIILVVVGVKGLGGSSGSGNESKGDSPMSILKKRFANGEIDEDEFKRRKNELDS